MTAQDLVRTDDLHSGLLRARLTEHGAALTGLPEGLLVAAATYHQNLGWVVETASKSNGPREYIKGKPAALNSLRDKAEKFASGLVRQEVGAE